jgi:glycosyltransferase involved in cell wall biosynthesis
MKASILFLSAMNGDPWGGSEEFWFRCATWMATNGYTVGCCFYDWPDAVKQDRISRLREAGCHVSTIPNPRTAKNAFHKISIRKKGYSLLKDICAKDWDMVCITQGGYEDVTHRPFRFLYQHLKKYVLVYHNYNDDHRLSRSRIKNLDLWTQKAVLNMGAARRIFEGVKNASGLIVPKQFVLINPLTIPWQLQPAAWPAKDEEGRYVLTMLAQLDTRRKAQEVLVKALSSSKWKERNWILYLYGHGEDMEMLKQLVKQHQIDDKIKLMGNTKEVKTVLEKTHLLLQITRIDAMPMSVTEAMNMARPCVVSRVGDMPQWITHGESGFIAPAVTEDGIDTVLEQAWQEKDKWQAMGLEAYRVFTEKYPQSYEKYYAELMMNL